MWRYTNPFLVFRPTKIFNYGWIIFYRLKLAGFSTAFILDALYHTKTLYYLNYNSYYTIGLIPMNLPANTLDLAIPSAVDSIFSQLFFLRFILSVKQATVKTQRDDFKNIWLSFFAKI